MLRLIRLALLTATAIQLAACATAAPTSYLPENDRLKHGRYVEKYWAAEGLGKQHLSVVFVEAVDTSRVQASPGVTLEEASDWLLDAVSAALQQGGFKASEQKANSTSDLSLAITFLTPGSAAGRMIAGELGMGHAIVQVEGRLRDSASGAELVAFSDRRRDSGSIGLEDIGGDAGPRLVKRMLEGIGSDLVKEMSEHPR